MRRDLAGAYKAACGRVILRARRFGSGDACAGIKVSSDFTRGGARGCARCNVCP